MTEDGELLEDGELPCDGDYEFAACSISPTDFANAQYIVENTRKPQHAQESSTLDEGVRNVDGNLVARKRVQDPSLDALGQSDDDEDASFPRPSSPALRPDATDMLFFPSIRSDLTEDQLRAFFHQRNVPTIVELRISAKVDRAPMQVRRAGKPVARFSYLWLRFRSPLEADAARRRLFNVAIADCCRLRPVFHAGGIGSQASHETIGGRPRSKSMHKTAEKVESEVRNFEQRSRQLRKRGGSAMTLLLRGIPASMSEAEVEGALRRLTPHLVQLRLADTQASLPRSLFFGGDARDSEDRTQKCWATYVDAAACAAAFRSLTAQMGTLPPGDFDVLNQKQPAGFIAQVSLHDDLTDAHNPAKKARVMEAVTPVMQKPCAFFLRGKCLRGEQCKFAHVLPRTRTPSADHTGSKAPRI